MNHFFARFLLGFHGLGSLGLAMAFFSPVTSDTVPNSREQDLFHLQNSRIFVDSFLPMLGAAMLTLAVHNMLTAILATDPQELSRGLGVISLWNFLGFFWHVRHLHIYKGETPPWIIQGSHQEFYWTPMSLMLGYGTVTGICAIWLEYSKNDDRKAPIKKE